MPYLISNLYEKAFTPYTARMAPKQFVQKPQLGMLNQLIKSGRKPQKVSRVGADPTVKRFWRFVRHWITHNHKIYYTFVVLSKLNSLI